MGLSDTQKTKTMRLNYFRFQLRAYSVREIFFSGESETRTTYLAEVRSEIVPILYRLK